MGGNGTTQLASIAMATGEAHLEVEVGGQVSSTVTVAGGGMVGVVNRGIYRIDTSGVGARLASLPGLPFELRVDANDRLAFLVVESADRSSAQMVDLKLPNPTPELLARGALPELGLDRSQGTFYLLGGQRKMTRAEHVGVVALSGASPNASVSLKGNLAVNAVSPAGMGRPFEDKNEEAGAYIEAWAPGTDNSLRFRIDPGADASIAASYRDEISVTPTDDHPSAPINPRHAAAGRYANCSED